MQQTVVPGIAMWSVWQPDRNVFFNSFFLASPEGNVAIDPLPASPADVDEIERGGGLSWIAITNRDHERDARTLAAHFGAKIAASSLDADLLKGPVDRRLTDGEAFAGATVIALDGLKTPGEFALSFPERRAVLVGDALWGDPAGSLRLMPDEKLANPAQAALSLRKLRAFMPEHLLVGDGACIFGNAHAAIWACLEARGDAYVNRINRDEATWKTWSPEPAGYGGAAFEIGDLIGARKLGYRLVRLPAQTSSSPLHWHAAEEELFVVMSGSVTLVTPRGKHALRAGDYVSFSTSPNGAHKIVNESSEPSEILMIANTDASDVCYYPDSRKVLVEATDLMVRDRPVLDYWDGE